jgi:hypothetical protein
MEKRLIATMVAAAFAGTAGVAVAGPISVASIGTYAAETIGAAAGAIQLGNVAYTLSSPFAINSTQTLKYVLSAKVNTCPVATFQPAVAGATISAPTLGADTRTCSYTVAVTGTAVPATTIANFVTALADKSAGATLAAGSPLTATVSVFDATNALVETNSANVAVAAQALSARWQASAPAVTGSLFPNAAGTETSKVDVLSVPVSTGFTNPADVTASTTTIVLGAFEVVDNVGGPFLDSNGLVPVNEAALTVNKWNLTVTGPFVANATAGMVFVSSLPTCGDNKGAFTVTGSTATLAGFDAKANLGVGAGFVCYQPNVGAKTFVINTGAFSGSATTSAATAVTATNMQGESASGSLYTLTSNGVQIDMRVMTTAATTGWTTVLRLINTGSVAAPVTATYLNTDGTVGASGQILANLVPGATAMISSAQVETALGVSLAASGNPPRLRITAPTNNMRVQAWVQSPNGAWFMGTPAQEDDADKVSAPSYINITPN